VKATGATGGTPTFMSRQQLIDNPEIRFKTAAELSAALKETL
jgi:hypothetical protein